MKMDERILVCVNYGPNGERLITRGGELANMLDCPLYILTVESVPEEELGIEKSNYLAHWRRLAQVYNAKEFIYINNEQKLPVARVIANVAREKHITQIILGQTAQSRWQEITKGSFVNQLLHEISFVDLHIVSVSRDLKYLEGNYEKGVRAYLIEDEKGYKLTFNYTEDILYEGIFFKEFGTDFNNGVFKFMKGNQVYKLYIRDDYVSEIRDLLKPDTE